MITRGKKIMISVIFIILCVVVFASLINLTEASGTTGSWENTSNTWDQYTPLAPLPGTTQGNCVTDKNGNVSGCTTDIQTYIPGVFNLAIGIAGVLAVLMIIIGGVEYVTTDAIQGKSDGKARIQNALWGLVLVLVSWILLYTINPKLTVFDLNVKGTKDTTSTETVKDNSGNISSSGNSSQGQVPEPIPEPLPEPEPNPIPEPIPNPLPEPDPTPY